MNEVLNTQAHFALQKGERDSDQLLEECFKEIATLLHNELIRVNGRICRVRVITADNRIMFDVRKPSGELDHIEFTINKTGWGRSLAE